MPGLVEAQPNVAQLFKLKSEMLELGGGESL